jgi:hypothetical protein
MSVHFAETIFRWLMRAYPARFSRTHGLALFELFRDEAREAHAARGALGLIVLLALTVAETATNAPGAWLDRGPTSARDDISARPPSRTDRRRFGGTGRRRRPAVDLSGWAQDVRLAARHLRRQ